ADQTYAKERLIEEQVTATNERTEELNRRIIGVLADVTGRDPEPDPRAWWQWWGDYTDTQLVGGKRVQIVAEDTEVLGDPTLRLRRWSCFAAGTPVWTESGQVAIEKIKVGDLVLAQNIETGELAYKPVVCTTVRPAKPLVAVTIEDEHLTATSGHRFWIAGDGWTKARDLQPGSLVHTVRGNAAVAAVKSGPTAETYNLVVADFHDYFVGRTGFLVQDLPLPQPTNAVVPGLTHRQLATHDR
ncbi:MAG: polymorphic toxin-type HINT domain-containing protein, partial [Deltaproteobacteria bacterium]